MVWGAIAGVVIVFVVVLVVVVLVLEIVFERNRNLFDWTKGDKELLEVDLVGEWVEATNVDDALLEEGVLVKLVLVHVGLWGKLMSEYF